MTLVAEEERGVPMRDMPAFRLAVGGLQEGKVGEVCGCWGTMRRGAGFDSR